MKKILTVFGTRPEAIKMAPVVQALAAHEGIESLTCVTAQHRQMLDQMLDFFGIEPDFDLDIMRADQDLQQLTCRALTAVSEVIASAAPDMLLVHGDTTTTFAASLAAHYSRVPVAHVEAGLRTGNLAAPWPEEANRKLTDALCELHFAPTESARRNLLDEGYADSRVFVTGNTVVDSLLQVDRRIEQDSALQHELASRFPFLESAPRYVLVTGHRRESYGRGFESICKALQTLARRYSDVCFVYPVHLNPRVREPVFGLLQGLDNVHLIDPVEYIAFVYLMRRSYLVLTDSGGIQEEAPSLRKPVLVMRDATERAEAMELGLARLTGTNTDSIVEAVARVLDDEDAYRAMLADSNPYGDGRAAQRIVDVLASYAATGAGS